jgi:glycosyltransferase involved in cell wall biosynthesis
MKLLVLLQGRKLSDHPGIVDAFDRLKKEGVLYAYEVLPYFGIEEHQGWDYFWDHALIRAKVIEADMVYFHHFHSPTIPDPTKFILNIQNLKKNPTIFVSCGDAFFQNPFGKRYPKSFRITSSLANITFITSMGRSANAIYNWGGRNIVLAPNGCFPNRFCSEIPKKSSANKDFDVIFIGSYLSPRNFLSNHFHSNTKRKAMIDILAKRYGNRFGLFGNGWNGYSCWHGYVHFNEQHKICRKGHVVFGGYPGSLNLYYSSNRVYNQISSGVPFVDFHVTGMERILRDDDHWFLFKNKDELIQKIDAILDEDIVIRSERAKRAAKYIRDKHTQYHRMKFVVQTVMRYREAKLKGLRPPKPDFDYFLPEVDLKEESKSAVRYWEY